jgi:hypothetical protein
VVRTAGVVFGCTLKLATPFPVWGLGDVIVAQGTLLVLVHGQASPDVTATLPLPPTGGSEFAVASSTNVHGDWVTL